MADSGLPDWYNAAADSDPNYQFTHPSASTSQPSTFGPTSGSANLSSAAQASNNAQANGTAQPKPPETSSSSSGSAPATSSGTTDYSGGNPYLTGLNYSSKSPDTTAPAQGVTSYAESNRDPGVEPVLPPSSAQPTAPAAQTAAPPPPTGPTTGTPGLTPQQYYAQLQALFSQAPQFTQNGGQFSAPGVNNWYSAATDSGQQQPGQQYVPVSWGGYNAALAYPQQEQLYNSLQTLYSGAGSMQNPYAPPTGAPPAAGSPSANAGQPTLPPTSAQPPQGISSSAPGGLATNTSSTNGNPISTGPAIGGVPRGTSDGSVNPSGPPSGVPSYTGTPPPVQPASSNASGIPNTYNPLNVQRPAYNYQPGAYQFAGNNGTGSPYPVTAPPAGSNIAIQPTLSPGMTGTYFQFLQNQATNNANGLGATPYGQQQVYLPGFGQSSMQGLTAPLDPQLMGATGSINSSVQTQANALPNINALEGLYNPGQQQIQAGTAAANANYANPQALSAQYNPLLQGASTMQQYGGMGYPGQGLSLESQYGAIGNNTTGAGALQGAAAGTGTPGLPGQFLNSATNTGGFGQPGQLQTGLAQTGQIGGQGNQTLTNMAQNGAPVDQTAAWQAAQEALKRQDNENMAQIAEHAAQSGNLAGSANGGGTGYNQAMTDYTTQAAKDRAAQLLAAQATAGENAANRQLSAGSQLQQGQIGALNNLSNTQNTAGLYGAGSQLTSSALMQQQIAQALAQMNQNQQFGITQGTNTTGQSQALPYNLANQSANTMLGAGGAQIGATNSQITNPYGIFNQGMNTLGGLQGQQMQAGQYYQGQDQNAINANLAEFERTQPEYSPLLGQEFQAATTFPGEIPPNATSGLGALVGQIGGTLLAPGGVLNPKPTP